MRAYPDHIVSVEENTIVWRDGTRIQIDDQSGPKSRGQLLTAPDLKDIFAYDYPSGDAAGVPVPDADPGRIRPSSLFEKMYGNCSAGEVRPHLADVAWLPGRSRQNLKVTRINGVADKLRAVSEELAALPPQFEIYLTPPAGTYACRTISGTDRNSAHGYGIAIDIAVKRADYWRWPIGSNNGGIAYRNRIPMEIVRVFERHGFIWGGKWHHFDTMHFEYRPELLLE